MDDATSFTEPARRSDRPHKRVVRWVSDYVRRESWLCIAGAVAAFLFGLLALFVTFWVWYGIVGFVTMTLFPLSHGALLFAAGIACVLLFVASWTADRAELERLDVEIDNGMRMKVFVAQAAGYGHLVPVLSLKYAAAYVKVLALILLIAPQSLTAAVRLVQRTIRLKSMNQDDCARTLMALLQSDGKVAFEELGHQVPGVDWAALLPTLREIIGIVFLFNDPPGLTIAPNLHDEITGQKRS